MLVRGILYILIFLAVLAIFAKFRSPKVRQAALLAASCALYLSWGFWFGAVLLASIIMNHLLGAWIRRQPTATALSTGILLNLALLSVFKYLSGIAITLPFSSLQKFGHLALPLGISFWTFQAMSYLLDLYRGEELDPSFVEFALYMAFFPVVVSGPICRLPDMLPQFRSQAAPSRHDIGRGLSRVATGVLMMQIAQLVGKGIVSGAGVNGGFDQLTTWGGGDVWCLALGYGLQVFFDFAGYSHLAIGAAQMLGFKPEQIKAGLLVPVIGNTYAGSSLIGLTAVLDEARPGQRIFMVSFGSGAGSDAFSLRVTDKIAERRDRAPLTKDYIARCKYVDYATYARYRHKLQMK